VGRAFVDRSVVYDHSERRTDCAAAPSSVRRTYLALSQQGANEQIASRRVHVVKLIGGGRRSEIRASTSSKFTAMLNLLSCC
jgi:hypothetical protein